MSPGNSIFYNLCIFSNLHISVQIVCKYWLTLATQLQKLEYFESFVFTNIKQPIIQ